MKIDLEPVLKETLGKYKEDSHFEKNLNQMIQNMRGIKNRRIGADSIIRNASKMVDEILETSGNMVNAESTSKFSDFFSTNKSNEI